MLFYFLFILTLSVKSVNFTAAQGLCRSSGIPEPENQKCGTLSKQSGFAAGGRSASREELPWQTAIYSKLFRPFMQICGGTVISAGVVISAAHCFWSDAGKQLPTANYAVAGGKLYRPYDDKMDITAQKSDVREIRIPPHFRGSATNFQDDIALLVLTTPFTLNIGAIRPVCIDFDYSLDEKHLADGNIGKVAGWGRTDENGNASPTLQVVELPAVDISRCYDTIEPVFIPAITSDKLCAGYINKGIAVCNGDSGGGLSFPEYSIDEPPRYYLRGIVSTAPKSPTNENNCNIYTYATFTRINKHEHFIREMMMQSSQEAYERTSKENFASNGLSSETTVAREFVYNRDDSVYPGAKHNRTQETSNITIIYQGWQYLYHNHYNQQQKQNDHLIQNSDQLNQNGYQYQSNNQRNPQTEINQLYQNNPPYQNYSPIQNSDQLKQNGYQYQNQHQRNQQTENNQQYQNNQLYKNNPQYQNYNPIQNSDQLKQNGYQYQNINQRNQQTQNNQQYQNNQLYKNNPQYQNDHPVQNSDQLYQNGYQYQINNQRDQQTDNNQQYQKNFPYDQRLQTNDGSFDHHSTWSNSN